jgi:hypothetical protein
MSMLWRLSLRDWAERLVGARGIRVVGVAVGRCEVPTGNDGRSCALDAHARVEHAKPGIDLRCPCQCLPPFLRYPCQRHQIRRPLASNCIRWVRLRLKSGHR